MISPVWLKTECVDNNSEGKFIKGGVGVGQVQLKYERVNVLLWSPRVCINQREHNLDQALIIRADYISYIMKYTLLTHC